MPYVDPSNPLYDPADPVGCGDKDLYAAINSYSYGKDDVLPTLAGDWIAGQGSVNTQRSYARGFKVFEEFARKHGIHPMAARAGLVGAFRLYLETAPTWRWVPGGELVRSGPPCSPNSRASTVCAANSFLDYLEKVSDGTRIGLADGPESVP